jgi:hypothetical protein
MAKKSQTNPETIDARDEDEVRTLQNASRTRRRGMDLQLRMHILPSVRRDPRGVPELRRRTPAETATDRWNHNSRATGATARCPSDRETSPVTDTHQLANPITGELIVLRVTAADSDGELLEFDDHWTSPDHRVAEHIHPGMTETWS